VFSLFILGLTGQSGAGKSYAAHILSQEGFAVLNADITARKVVEAGSPCLNELSEAFGSDIINKDGTLNRRLLAKKAFADKISLNLLNSITHPHIIKAINAELLALRQNGERIVVLDAPALYESGADGICDAVAVVTAKKELCLKRIMERDLLTLEQSKERINAQPNEEYYTSRAAYVIRNDDNMESFTNQIKDFATHLKKKFAD
jgi:dephospho-CoA kinase